MKRETRDRLYTMWRSGQALAAGREIMEALTPERRAARAAAVLSIALKWLPACAAIRHVLEIAADAARWREAHDAFSAVRHETLRMRDTADNPACSGVLFLAENAAKTLYNASGEPAPFDHDSPWWIASNAWHIAEATSNVVLQRELWAALIGDVDAG